MLRVDKISMRFPNITLVMTGGVPLIVVLDWDGVAEVAVPKSPSELRLLRLATARKTRRPKTRMEMMPTVMEEMVAIPMLPPMTPESPGELSRMRRA